MNTHGKPIYDSTTGVSLLPHLDRVHTVFEHHYWPNHLHINRYERYLIPVEPETIRGHIAEAEATNAKIICVDIEGGVPDGDGPWGGDDGTTSEQAKAGRLMRRGVMEMYRQEGWTGGLWLYNYGRPGYSWQDHTSRQQEVEDYARTTGQIDAEDPISCIDLSTGLCPAFYTTGVGELTFENWKPRVDATIEFMENEWHRVLYPYVMPVYPNAHVPDESYHGKLVPYFEQQIEYLLSNKSVGGVVIWAGPNVETKQSADWLQIGKVAE